MLKTIKQTNRTILFDVVNPELPDLFTFMSDVDEDATALTDEKIKEIHTALLVKSFDEFLEKFKPTIYCYYGEKRNEYGEVISRGMHYDLEPPNSIPKELVKEIVIDKNNDFLKMFISMMEKKSAAGVTNVDFDYEKVTKMLSPEKTLNDVKKLKKDIAYLEGKNAELERDSPAKEQAAKNLILTYEKTRKYYSETSVQLKLTLSMLKENLNQLTAAKTGAGETFSVVIPALSGAKGDLHAFPAPSPEFFKQLKEGSKIAGELTAGSASPDAGFSADEQKWLVNASSTDKALATRDESEKAEPRKKLTLEDYQAISVARIEKQFDEGMIELYKSAGQEYDVEEHQNSLARELAVCAFTGKASESLQLMTPEEKMNKYNLYSQINASWQKAFIRTAKPLLEKILNVKAFFDQYRPKIKQMQPSLIVVNSNLENIVDAANLENLGKYLNTVNNTNNFTDMIWFGIVPDMRFSDDNDFEDIDEEAMRELGYTGDIDKGAEIVPTEMDSLQTLLSFMQDPQRDYRIQVFFSFEANEQTTFTGLATGSVDPYIAKTEMLAGQPYSRYAIPCFPNFTVIPNDKTKVNLGSPIVMKDGKMQFSSEREDAAKFWIYGVYVSAAHVAAGLVAACQCPKHLETKFASGVRGEFPGARFDIEANANFVPTTMAKEIGGYVDSIKNRINDTNFGFVFSSDNVYAGGQPVKSVTVYKARCMDNNTDNGNFKSIFIETASTCIYRYIKAMTEFRQPALGRIFTSGDVNSWRLIASGNPVNSILRPGDSIDLKKSEDGGNEYTIALTFGGISQTMTVKIDAN